MKMPFPKLLAALLLFAACAGEPGRGPGAERELTVSAAASLRDALQEIARDYEAAHPGVRVRLNFASSGTLQQQIRHGAPVDVFVSAAQRQMDQLQAAGSVVAATRRNVASNELVLVVPAAAAGGPGGFEDLASPVVDRVAIGAPASVPAGSYAEETLAALGIADAVLAKTVRGQHVRQVLSYVELGEVDAGIVYRTDARGSERVRVVASAPEETHAPIRYPAAVVSGTRHPEEARAFVEHLAGPEGRRVLARFGFGPPDPH